MPVGATALAPKRAMRKLAAPPMHAVAEKTSHSTPAAPCPPSFGRRE